MVKTVSSRLDGLTNAEKLCLQAFGATRSAFRFEGAELGVTQKFPWTGTFEMGSKYSYEAQELKLQKC